MILHRLPVYIQPCPKVSSSNLGIINTSHLSPREWITCTNSAKKWLSVLIPMWRLPLAGQLYPKIQFQRGRVPPNAGYGGVSEALRYAWYESISPTSASESSVYIVVGRVRMANWLVCVWGLFSCSGDAAPSVVAFCLDLLMQNLVTLARYAFSQSETSSLSVEQ